MYRKGKSGLWALALVALCAAAGCAAASPQTVPLAVPFDFERQLALVEGEIAGERLAFIVDTGVDPSGVDLAAAERLGLPVDRDDAGLASGQGSDEVRIYAAEIRGLRLGGAEIDPVAAVAIDMSGIAERYGRPVHGILGISFLRGHVVRFDYAGRRLVIDPEGPACPAEGLAARLPFDPEETPPKVEGFRINGQPVIATLDTGSNGSMQISAGAAERLGIEPVEGDTVSATGARGGVTLQNAGTVDLELGPWRGEAAAVIGPPVEGVAARDVNIGNVVLSHFMLTVDYPAGVVCLNEAGAD